ncbi:VOC family protein [Sphingomonas sp. CGMCC 1.13654]|uniref:VOC family protein n=1 Tax=Sphingomonas chungangi TaxID=2683589 RepID=A0A838L265_9SPHN|nr:VOC family protein [Sphingomonas chungangi]MBA2933147.1 VOC family protein [Sphingomonas chungangi]MVW57819.1 VOC family protein [Sphingomonas chungangi]
MSLRPFGILAAVALIWQGAALAEQPGHVTGIGGVFVKSKNPRALAEWYREVLGLDVKPWGGAAMPFDAPGHPPKIAWTAFPDSSDHMSPSAREFMINFAVDDMDAIVARLTAHGVPIIKRDDDDSFGRFAWIQDPDGTKIELWQPKRD